MAGSGDRKSHRSRGCAPIFRLMVINGDDDGGANSEHAE
jgi:hypothetical protein